MVDVDIYTKENCPYCIHAKRLLDELQVDYQEIRVDLDSDKLAEMLQRAEGRRTLPQIIIGGKAIGGFDDLAKLHELGKLKELLG